MGNVKTVNWSALPYQEGKMMVARNELRRQREIVAGVCGGLGEFYGISPWWFRFAFILLALPGGVPGILAYLVAWIVIPRKR
jgi:phage shock protein C